MPESDFPHTPITPSAETVAWLIAESEMREEQADETLEASFFGTPPPSYDSEAIIREKMGPELYARLRDRWPIGRKTRENAKKDAELSAELEAKQIRIEKIGDKRYRIHGISLDSIMRSVTAKKEQEKRERGQRSGVGVLRPRTQDRWDRLIK